MDCQKVENFVAKLLASLEEAERQGKTSVRRKLSTLVKGVGMKKRSEKLMSAYDRIIREKAIYCSIDLLDSTFPPKTWIYFSRDELQQHKPGFINERAMEIFIARRLEIVANAIPKVGTLYLEHGGLRSQKVYHLDGKGLRPDMVLHTGAGQKVVVELKKGPPKFGLADQITRYIKAVAKYYDVPALVGEGVGNHVIGLLITSQPTSKADRLLVEENITNYSKAGFDIHWGCYRLDFDIDSANTG